MAKKINFTTTNSTTLATLSTIEHIKVRIAEIRATANADLKAILATASDIFEVEADAITIDDVTNAIKAEKHSTADHNTLLNVFYAYDSRKARLTDDLRPLNTRLNSAIRAFVPNYLYECYTGAVGMRQTNLVSHELFYPRLIQWFNNLGYDVPDVMSEHAVAKNLDVFMARVLGGKKNELSFKKQVYANFMNTLTTEKGVLTVADDGTVTNTYAVA